MRRVFVCVVMLGLWCGLAVPAEAADEVVVYAADAASMTGAWSRVADPTAAGGQKATSTDVGWAACAARLPVRPGRTLVHGHRQHVLPRLGPPERDEQLQMERLGVAPVQ